MFHCFLTLSFVLLGASVKSRCLKKLLHPTLLSSQVKTVIYIYKIASLGAWESCHTPHCSASKWKQWFLYPKLPDFCHFLANSGCFCGRGAILWSKNPLLVSENLTYDHLMKIKRSVAIVTAIRRPFRAESGSFWVILNVFWPIQAASVVEQQLCDLKMPSWVLHMVT